MTDVLDLSVRRVLELACEHPHIREWRVFSDDDGNIRPPSDERQVLVFFNGHVDLADDLGRRGGPWGISLGFFDHEKRAFRAPTPVQGAYVTHWMDLPGPPVRSP